MVDKWRKLLTKIIPMDDKFYEKYGKKVMERCDGWSLEKKKEVLREWNERRCMEREERIVRQAVVVQGRWDRVRADMYNEDRVRADMYRWGGRGT